MSHYFALVLTEDGHEDEIARLLSRYDENLEVPAYKSFMDAKETKAMAEWAETTDLDALAAKMHEWRGQQGGVEAGQLFTWSTYNPMSKWDWYQIGGRWSDAIPSNRCRVSDLPDDCAGRVIVLPTGEWIERGRMGWFGVSHGDIEETEWRAIVTKTLSEYPDYIATGVDLHI